MKRLDLGNLTWYDMDSLPYPGIYNITSFELNNEFYIGMGANADSLSACCGDALPSKKFWKYTPATNQWTRLANFPGSHQNFPTCFSIGSKGYAFYGAIPIGNPNITTTFTQEMWEYEPGSNTWTKRNIPPVGAPPPGEKYQILVDNGKAYFLTGQIRKVGVAYYYWSPQNTCLEYDPITGVSKRFAYMKDPNIIKPIGKVGNKFYYQTDALGYFETIPNKTFSFTME